MVNVLQARVGGARMAEGRRVYAVGDIHGRADLLAGILDLVDSDFAMQKHSGVSPCLIFLGDYVDRGLESRRCIDLLVDRALSGAETHFLIGQHDLAMLRFIGDPVAGARWLRMGGAETLFSYGVRAPGDVRDARQLRMTADALSAAMPRDHQQFFRELKLHVRLGDYLFVHAGLRPGAPLERQSEDDLVSIRDAFTRSREVWPFVVVHGHAPVEQILIDERRIAVDTGAYLTGRLSAVCLEGECVWRLST